MTQQPFPLANAGPPPAWYADVTSGPSASEDGTFFTPSPIVTGMFANRYNVYYVGQTVAIQLKFGQDFSTLTGWTVRDYFGNIAATGSIALTGTNNVVTLGSGFGLGWYRVYLTGTHTDTNYGPAYGSTMFGVIRQNSNFPTFPVSKYNYNQFKFIPDGLGATDAQIAAGSGAPSFDNGVDIIMRACLGIPMGRLSSLGSSSPFNPDGGGSDRLTHDNLPYCQGVLQDWYLNPTNPAWKDPARPRPVFMAFPNGNTADVFYTGYALGVVKDHTVDGSKVFIASSAGSTSGQKIQVYYPNSSTLVETYDNLASDGSTVEASINGVSNYIIAAGLPYGAVNQSATAIGNSCRNGVMAIVSALFPLGVTHYEGPQNEPAMNDRSWNLRMKVFADAVHDAAPGAKTIGPCTVTITNQLDNWRKFLTAGNGYLGGGAYCDEFSFHDYNTCLVGDINQGRANIETFLAMLAEFGLQHKPLWQTEATGGSSNLLNGAIFFPRRASGVINRLLLYEQYGMPREKNPYWYQQNHGFWGDPCWLENSDFTVMPQAILMCTLGQETFGMNHHHRIDFASVPANNLFLGSVYGNPLTGSTAVMVCTSAMPSSTVTLTVTGTTSALTVIDAFGNSSTVTPSSGRVTVTVKEVPTYLRLPAGVTVSVYSVRDWAHGPSPSISATRTSSILGGVESRSAADDRFFNYYSGGGGLTNSGLDFSPVDLPDSCEIKFGQTVSVERILVFCGPPYQAMPAIFTYTVDTWDGTSWTTQNTITKTPPASIHFGEVGSQTGATYEQYWDGGWVDDEALTGGPLSCKGVRISVTAASYGGGVDANANSVGVDWGATVPDPHLAIQEISVISPTTVTLGVTYPAAVLADSPNGYWRLGEPAGSTVGVSQVNAPAVNGTYTGPCRLGVPSVINDGDTAMLNPLNQVSYLFVPSGTNLNLGDTCTLEMWVNLSSFAGSPHLVNHWASGGTSSWFVYAEISTGLPVFAQGNGNVICKGTVGFALNQWQHLVVTKSTSTVHMYLNGVDVTGTVTNHTLSDSGSPDLYIGDYNQIIDEVAIYPTALSSTRVLAHYNAAFRPGAPVNRVAPRIEGG